jgi:CRISPR-associated endonuclease/helicase Cas3
MPNVNESPRAWAHTPNTEGDWHDLADHLTAVAEMARSFAEPFGGGETAYWAGLWHDLGKFHPEFQGYLAACERARREGEPAPARSVDHKGAGTVQASRCAGPLAFLIAGHHGGLHNRSDLQARLNEWTGQPRVELALERARIALSFEPPTSVQPPSWALASPHTLEFFLRMLFSCLVDADFLDTEAHFQSDTGEVRASPPALAELWPHYADAMTAISGREDTEVARLRDEVFRACVAAGRSEPGFFRLTVPTGGGKTLASLGFALEHALAHGQQRVIVAVPYTSITEQTAEVYRGVFRALPRAVLEHHSAMAPRPDSEESDGSAQWERLAAENWDAPLVVTTTVRLFESLFARRTSDCRRLHRVANSIIILDEAQTIPTHLLTPLLDVFRELTAHYGASTVFCTATQPALDETPGFRGLPNVREIAPQPSRLFRSLKRVNYEWPRRDELRSWAWVAAEMRSSDQALAIVNTKDDAVALLDSCGPDALHLSTSLCGEHRRAVLAEVRQRLKAAARCHLVTTQVIEAGVDVDFPLVLRAFGPLDRIVQAAGRCNREGRLPNGGRLIAFEPEGNHMPRGDYRTGSGIARMMLVAGDIDPDEPNTFLRYFARLYDGVALDPHAIQQLRSHLEFQDVAEHARVIEDDGVPVIVPYRADSGDRRVDRLVARTRAMPGVTRGLLRDLQPFIVSVRGRLATEFERDGLLEQLHPGLFWWRSTYDPVRGIVARTIAPDQLVI